MFAVIDPDLKRAFADLNSEQPLEIPDWQHGSTVPLEVCIARRIANPSTPRVREPVDISLWSMRAALGQGFLLPTQGTFTLTFGADTTAAIDFDCTDAEMEAALDLLASVIAAGGVTVSGENGFFTVAFGSNGDRALITGTATNLAPSSVIDIGALIEGTAGRPEVQVIRVVQNPGALANLTILSDGPSAAVVPVQTGGAGLNAKARVILNARSSGTLVVGGVYRIVNYAAGDDFVNIGGVNATGDVFTATGTTPTTWTNLSVLQRVGAQPPYDGQFSILVRGWESALIDHDAEEADVVAALEEIQATSGLLVVGAKYKIVTFVAGDSFTNVGAASNATGVVFTASGTTPTTWTNLSVLSPVAEGNVSVAKEEVGQYLIAFQGNMANTAMGVLSADGSGLRAMKTLSGTLDLRNANIDLLLNGEPTVSVSLEIEGTPPEETLQKLFREAGTLVDAIVDPSNTSPPNAVAYALKTVAGKYRFKDDGSFQLWNADQNKFHTITITGAAGAEVPTIAAGED
jgi:hypothetical protein